MWAYLLLLALPALWAASGRLPPRARRAVLLLVAAALIVFLGLRRGVGCDWNNYLIFFHRARIGGLLEALTVSDPGYMLLAWIVSHLGLGIGILNLAIASFFTLALLLFVRDQPRPALALLVATPVLIAIVGLAATRQSLAVALLLLALHFQLAGRRRLPAALLAAAPFFHWSAALLLPLAAAFLIKRRIPFRPVVSAAAAASAAVALAILLVPGIGASGPEGVAEGALYRTAPTALAVLAALALAWRGRLRAEEERAFACLTALALAAMAFAPLSPTITDRLGYFAIPLQILAFTRLPDLFAGRRLRIAAIAVIASFYVLMFAAWAMLTTQGPCLVPYDSYLRRPHLLFDGKPEEPVLPCGLTYEGDLIRC